jgi:hypothetical protein
MMDTNAILTILIAPAAIALVGAIKVLWDRVTGDLDDCKKDRVTLFGKVDELQGKLTEVSESVGEMRGRLNMVEK